MGTIPAIISAIPISASKLGNQSEIHHGPRANAKHSRDLALSTHAMAGSR